MRKWLLLIFSLVAAGCGVKTGSPAALSVGCLAAMDSAAVSKLTIMEMNLACAEGLRGSLAAEPGPAQRVLASWAERVRTETDRHLYRFRQNPAAYERSEGYFRMLMLTVVLAEDFKVHYREDKRTAPGSARTGDGFFSDPNAVFLTGLLGPQREGTCSSMPVLYVAVGRQLGYPVKLVTTKGHLFVRWEGTGERFNIEATAKGLATYDDDYYRHWPFEITREEEAAEGYLKSLTPAEELAVFLSIRGMCQQEAGQVADAAQSFAAAARLAPGCDSYRRMAEHLTAEAGDNRLTKVQLKRKQGPL